jgi:transposase-like protein
MELSSFVVSELADDFGFNLPKQWVRRWSCNQLNLGFNLEPDTNERVYRQRYQEAIPMDNTSNIWDSSPLARFHLRVVSRNSLPLAFLLLVA